MKKIYIYLLALLITPAYSQSKKADSLQVLIKTETDERMRAFLLNELSYELHRTDLNRSISIAEQAATLARHSNDMEQLARAQLYIGVQNYYLGKYENALKAYLAALKIYEERKDKNGMATVLNELGTFNKKQGDLKKSKSDFEQALSLSLEVNDSAQVANSMNNLGIVYEMEKDYSKAMNYYKRSAVIKESIHDLNGVSYNYDNMGALQAQLGNFKDAEIYLIKVIEIRKKLNHRIGYAMSLSSLGEMYMAKKDYGQARKYLLPALQLTYETQYKELRSRVLFMLSEAYKAENSYKDSYQYLVKSNSVKDSVFNEQKSKQLLEMQTKYDTEKKESQIKLLQQENELKESRLQRNQLFVSLLVIAIAALVFFGFLWRNRLMLKQKVELESTKATLRESQLQAVISSQEEERKRFAEDLHDGMGQLISAVKLNLSKEYIERNALDHAVEVLNEMNAEIRNIAFNLMPQVLIKGGFEDALNELAYRINNTGKVNITVSAFDLEEVMTSDRKVALYRVCQEWINNVIKYSSATKVMVQLVQHADELVITIEDNGNGFDPSQLATSKGNGWRNINSRLTMVHGQIDIDSTLSRQGTTVTITIPSLVSSLAA